MATSLAGKPLVEASWALLKRDPSMVVLLVVGRWEAVDRKWRGEWAHIGQPDYDDYLTGELRRALVWQLGGSTLSGWQPVLAVLPYLAGGIGVLLASGHALNVLQFGDEQARQLGLPVERVRRIVVVAATLTTAAAVAFAGVIGFVGLIVPHLVRLAWGGDYRRLLPLSTLEGAAFLLVCDVLARSVMAPQELPVGVITSLAGAPFFLWVLRRAKQQSFW